MAQSPSMTSQHADRSHRQRVDRVVAAIAADPVADHRLEDLARIAHFSPFHFHRIYGGVAGESVAATVRRVRLAQATRLLQEGRQSITQVALAVGYESPQAFTRAFGQFTGQSPRAFQQQLHRVILDPLLASRDGCDAAMPEVRVVERPAQRLRALRHQGPVATIPHTHRRLRLHVGGRAVSEWLGVGCGDPMGSASFRYYAAVVSPEDWPCEAEVEMLDVPGGLYAMHCLAGPYSRITAAINALYARWLPGSGFEPDDRPMLERYLNSPRDAAQADLRTELLIPVRAARAA